MALKEYNYYYEKGALIRSCEFDIVLDNNEFVTSKTQNFSTVYSYDSEGTLERKVVTSQSGLNQVFYYEKSEKGDTVIKADIGDSQYLFHSKTDSFGRKVFDEIQGGATALSREFSYHEGEITDAHIENNKVKSAPTTLLVKDITFSDGRTLSYEYDNEERITKVTDSVDGVTEYTYDALGQLLTETKGETVVNSMVYDNYGNIVSKNGISYGYDSTWKDLLVSYNNTPIVYDAQGNPTTYLGHTLTWEKGRQLKSFDNISYTYNAKGIRTSKTINGVEHKFTIDGTKILRIDCEQNYVIEPIYDNEDSVCGLYYNSEPFYFQKNLQGDIIAISDYWGNIVARYTYDAWGKITNISGTRTDIAEANPFRYRGYFYDTETDLYYLQSRYYDANTGRFINADEIAVSCVQDAILSKNIFAYCNNTILNTFDPSGYISIRLCVCVPKKNSSVVWAYKDGEFTVGHAYIILDPENDKRLRMYIKKSRGFYADTEHTVRAILGRYSVNGKIRNDASRKYDESVYYNISADSFKKAYVFIQSTNKKYNIVSYNCSTFAIEALNVAGVKHKFKKHFWNLGTAVNISIIALAISAFRLHFETSYAKANVVAGVVAILMSYACSYGYTPGRLGYDISKGVR